MSIDTQIPPVASTALADETGEWEDVPDTRITRQESDSSLPFRARPRHPSVPTTPRSTTRRRKAGKTISVAQLQSVPRRTAQPQKVHRRPLIDIDRDQVQEALALGTAESVRYFGSVITHALRLLRRPLAFLLFLWLLGIMLSKVSNSFRAVFAPVCWVPGISSTPLCHAPPVRDLPGLEPPKKADYPRLVEIQSANFEQLLDGSVGGSALSLEIKKAEMATKDLITLVKVSELRSRDLLAESLFDFVEEAKKTGKGLQRLTSKVNGAVDKIMAINDYALHTIEDAQAQPNSLMRAIWPFGSTPPSQAAVIEAFRTSMEVHTSEMQRLVLELETSSANLDQLDEHLSTLHEICTRENLTLSAARDALLSELWTILGVNNARLRTFSTNLELLHDLGEYRKRAAAHVAAAMQTLQAMGEDMEDLRERVAAPEIVGDKIPVEVHMKSIRSGMERLKEERIKARSREEILMNKILGIDT